jgi:hypothetical protein
LTNLLLILFHRDLIAAIHHPTVSKDFQANLLILPQLSKTYGITLKIQSIGCREILQAKRRKVELPPSFELVKLRDLSNQDLSQHFLNNMHTRKNIKWLIKPFLNS